MTWTAVACALVTGLAAGYAVEEARRLASGRRFRLVSRGQAVRRIVGSLLVSALMVLVYVGLERIDPHATPGLYFTVWGAAGFLVVVLLALALLDLRELRANQDIERAREILGMRERDQAGRNDDTSPNKS